MPGNSFGRLFRISTWGESHGKAVGVVLDGCPSGIKISEEDIQFELDRRRPGQSKITTQRNEPDKVEILSGVFGGKTTGTPISMIVWNIDAISKSYEDIKDTYRPGHADFTPMWACSPPATNTSARCRAAWPARPPTPTASAAGC